MARDKHGNCLLNGVMGAIGKDRSLERRDHLRENNLEKFISFALAPLVCVDRE
jgi:hypothetical protein